MKRLQAFLAVVALVAFAAPAKAELIEGKFTFTLAEVTVALVGGFGEIDWVPPLNVGVDGTATWGTFEMNPAPGTRTGVFSHPDFGTLEELERIQDMSENPADANYVPQGASGGVTDFFVLWERDGIDDFLGEGETTWNFTETFLTPGQFGTPFFFEESDGSTTVSIFLSGFAWDDATPLLISNWQATITAQYTGWSIDELFACLQFGLSLGPQPCQVYGGGFALPENSWSGDFIATDAAIPEPATLLTFGLGAGLLAARRRRRAKA